MYFFKAARFKRPIVLAHVNRVELYGAQIRECVLSAFFAFDFDRPSTQRNVKFRKDIIRESSGKRIVVLCKSSLVSWAKFRNGPRCRSKSENAFSSGFKFYSSKEHTLIPDTSINWDLNFEKWPGDSSSFTESLAQKRFIFFTRTTWPKQLFVCCRAVGLMMNRLWSQYEARKV